MAWLVWGAMLVVGCAKARRASEQARRVGESSIVAP